MKNLKIVLKESVSIDDISLYAWQQDWELHDVYPRTEKTPLTKIWVTSDGQTGVHYFEDFYINNKYLLLKGQNQEQIAETIYASLDVCSLEEIRQKLQQQNVISKNEYINTILSLGVAINQDYSQELFNDFERLMSNPDSDVREAAIFATTYLGWREFREPLQRIKNEDLSTSVREIAADTLASLEKNHWQRKSLGNELSRSEGRELSQLQQELNSDRKQLENLQSQFQKVEARIENSRRTNIFGRPQSGENERERDKLTREIKDVKSKIAAQESAIKALEE